jgi:CheY-like chemotaxis protein
LNSCRNVAATPQKEWMENLAGITSTITADTISVAAFEQTEGRGAVETILLVEDEAFVRQVTAEVLGSAGYRMLIARTAIEALETCVTRCKSVDLLLADVVLPGMSGCELAAEFAILCPQARILLMSGHAEHPGWRELSQHGKKCLIKPFSTPTLLNSVRAALDSTPFDVGRMSIPH